MDSRFGGFRRAALLVAGAITVFVMFVPAMNSANAALPGAQYNTTAACEGLPRDIDTKLVAFKSMIILVNEQPVSGRSTDLSNRIQPGDQITMKFELKPECNNTYVGLDMWNAPTSKFEPHRAGEQQLASRTSGPFPAGTVEILTATVPQCYYQMDINTGWEYKPGDYTLDVRGRLLYTATGGTQPCSGMAAATTTSTMGPTTTVGAKATATAAVKAQAAIRTECNTPAGAGAVLVFDNPGTAAARFDVTENGLPVAGSPFSVDPHTKDVQKLLALDEDETATIKVVSTGANVDVEQPVTLDCAGATAAPTTVRPTTTTTASTLPARVLAAPAVPAAPIQPDQPQLAETGFNIYFWEFVGFNLMLVGFGCLYLARQRQWADF